MRELRLIHAHFSFITTQIQMKMAFYLSRTALHSIKQVMALLLVVMHLSIMQKTRQLFLLRPLPQRLPMQKKMGLRTVQVITTQHD